MANGDWYAGVNSEILAEYLQQVMKRQGVILAALARIEERLAELSTATEHNANVSQTERVLLKQTITGLRAGDETHSSVGASARVGQLLVGKDAEQKKGE